MTMSPWPFVPFGLDVTVVGGEGRYLHLKNGAHILDAAGGAIVANIGHGRSEVAEAYARAAATTGYVVPPFATPERLELVERLTARWLPPEMTRVFVTSGGSESTDAAMRLARQYQVAKGRTERWKVIGRDISYHGATLATLAVGGHAGRRRGLEPLLLDLPHAPTPYTLRGLQPGMSEAAYGEACADALEALIAQEGPHTVAGFIAEPIVGASGGALVPPATYWPRVSDICRRHDIVLIADEVMTGFGRTGTRFAVEHWGVVPDVIVGGKGMGGGYAPIGGLYATEAIVEPLMKAGDQLMYFTFGAHPAACAASSAVLAIMERENLVARAAEAGERFGMKLARLNQHPHIAETRGLGLLRGIEIVRDKETLEPFAEAAHVGMRVVQEALTRGVFVYPAGTGIVRDIVLLGPAFTVTDAELDTIVDVLNEAVTAAVAGL